MTSQLGTGKSSNLFYSVNDVVQERGRAGDGRGVELPVGQLQGAGGRGQPAGREATPAQFTPPPTRLHLQASSQ